MSKAQDIAAIGQIEALPTLLEVLCDITGMRFAAVARVTNESWTACAVKDDIDFGLSIGGELPVETTLCLESMQCRGPIAIDHASQDPRYRDHHTPRIYKIESYISVPIVLGNGQYFGNLCAIDPAPAQVNEPRIINTFTRFASLIALALDNQAKRERDATILNNERATSELRDQFIGILGHDLRNPLQAVQAAGEILQRRPTDPALVSELAGRIKTNVKRMSALIDDVLDFTRGKLGGGIGITVADVEDLNLGLQDIVTEFRVAQPDREILATIHVTRKVRCDLGRVQQVASNLIANALTHGASSSPVKLQAHTEAEDFVLSVWNAGEPIPAESLSKIFEPFWRNSMSETRQGLGLGLHICSQIVRAHNGTLSVTSTREAGTQFTARLRGCA